MPDKDFIPSGVFVEGMELDLRTLTFAARMQKEQNDNAHKGSIFQYAATATFTDYLYEIEWHKAKMMKAILDQNWVLRTEFAADLANYFLGMYFREGIYELDKTTAQKMQKYYDDLKPADQDINTVHE